MIDKYTVPISGYYSFYRSVTRYEATGEFYKTKNWEREGFLGFFKFWLPWEIEIEKYRAVEDKSFKICETVYAKAGDTINLELVDVPRRIQ